jgi:hypothetical protein
MFESLRRWFKGSSRVRRIKVRTNQIRPRLEILEDRLAPSFFNDSSLADMLSPPDGIVMVCSAIEADNVAGMFAVSAFDVDRFSSVFDINPTFTHVSAIVTDDGNVTAEFDSYREPSGRDDNR